MRHVDSRAVSVNTDMRSRLRTIDRERDPRTLAERTARAAALCGRPDPRPSLQRNFGGSAEAALLRRGRDRRSDLGRGRRDLAGPAGEGVGEGVRIRPHTHTSHLAYPLCSWSWPN